MSVFPNQGDLQHSGSMSAHSLSVSWQHSSQYFSMSSWHNTLILERKHAKEVSVVYRQVIAANFNCDTQLLEVSYLDRRKQRSSLSLVKLSGVVQDSKNEIVSTWIETLMHFSYEGMPPSCSCILLQESFQTDRFWGQTEPTTEDSYKSFRRCCMSTVVFIAYLAHHCNVSGKRSNYICKNGWAHIQGRPMFFGCYS